MGNLVSFAIIGCGYWGAKHVRIAHQSPELEVAIAVDTQDERLNYIAKQYPGVSTGNDFAAALESDAEGVIIATPISTHYDLAKLALLAGKHVLVEKPLARTSAECLELISLADERGLTLMVGHTFEYHPAVVKTREIVQSGSLGTPLYAHSRRLNLGLYQKDANVLWDLAPHDLSIIFSVFNTDLEEVDAWGDRHILTDLEDVVYAKLDLANGVSAHVHVSWLDPLKVRQFTVVGSEGMLVFDDIEPIEKVRVYDKRFKPVMNGDTFADFQSAYHNGDSYAPELPSGEPLQLEVLDFANSIRTGKKPRTDGHNGLRVVAALEKISQKFTLNQSAFNKVSLNDGIGQQNIIR